MNIEEAIAKSGGKNPLDTGSRKYAQELLAEGEELLFAYNANFAIVPTDAPLVPKKVLSLNDKKSGVIAVTNNRVFVCNRVLGNATFKEIRKNNIQSVDEASNALLGMGQVRIKGLTEYFIVDLNNKQRKTVNEFISSINQ